MPSRQALLIILAYVYALFPLIPTLTTAASIKFKLSEGFGKWWGIYCIDRASWWRIGASAAVAIFGRALTSVRPITLTPPLLVTAGVSVMAISSLYQSSDHPSITIRPTRQRWLLTFYLLISALAAISYVIVEQVIGWVWDWWPRIFECEYNSTAHLTTKLILALLCILLLLPYACNRHVWRPYGYWIRFKRCPPPPTEETLPLSRLIGPPKRLMSKDSDSDISARNHLSTTSSFYAYPTPVHDLRKPSLYPLDTILESDTYSPRREVPGRTGQALQVRFQSATATASTSATESESDLATHLASAGSVRYSRPESPPFVYSVAGTMNTSRTAPQSAEILASPARTYQAATSPSSFYSHLTRSTHAQAGRQAPPPLRIIGPSPIATLVSDDMSVYSRSSGDFESQSGVTSVFATRHSKGSSLPQFTPSLRVDMNGRDSVGGEVVFAGARVTPSPPQVPPDALLQRPRFGRFNSRSPPGTPETMESMNTAETGGSAGTFGRRLQGRGGKI